MEKKLLVGAVALALILGVYGVMRPAEKIVQRETVETKQIGAIPGDELNSERWAVNGVETIYRNVGLNQASTTVCSVMSPAATSTLRFVSFQTTTGTTTSLAYEIGKATVPDATSTRIAYQIGAGRMSMITGYAATSTGGLNNGDNAYTTVFVFAPNSYLNVKYGGAGGTLNVLKGSCKAEFRSF